MRPPRPRDELGRPLAHDSGVPVEPDPPLLAPGDALDEATRLVHAGRAFRAHEVLEAVWKAAPPDERQLWRGLAQLAVGVTHSQRGNRKGAAALLQRGAANLLAHDGASYDIDIELLVAWARDAANAATTGNPLPPCPADWRSGRG